MNLYKLLLINMEAQIAYQLWYRAFAAYPLPVTIFQTKDLEMTQKECISLLLPKMGMHQKMPQEAIFGPKLLGGFQMTNLLTTK